MFAYCDVCWCWFVTLFIPNFCPAIHLVTHHRAKTHFSPIFFTVWHFFLKSKVVRMNIFAKKGGRNPHFRTLYYAIILCKRMILRILSSSVNSITVFTKKLLPSQKLYMVCAKKSLWSSWNIYLEKAPLWTPQCFKIAKGKAFVVLLVTLILVIFKHCEFSPLLYYTHTSIEPEIVELTF